jgi:hypothetical protein
MPKTDLTPIRTQLRSYMQARGISYNPQKKTWRCPGHGDEDPSAVLYENPTGGILHCPVCHKNFDIFSFCGALDGIAEFRDQLKSVRATLGIPEPERERKPRKAEPQPFPDDKKAEFEDVIKSLIAKKGEITGSWKYNYPEGVKGIDIRFEKPGEKKEVLTFWYDGQRLKWTDPPVLIYNIVEVGNDKPLLVHEGAKCAAAAGVLDHFASLSWSGGSGKAGLADWSALADAEVYVLPDDDAPGIKAARAIKQAIPHAKIIRPLPAARSLKPKGADIVEVLQVMTPDEFTAYALDPANHMDVSEMGPDPNPPGSDQAPPPSNGQSGSGLISEPFKILGQGDDGRAVFITQEGRLVKWHLDTLSKNKLIVLTGRAYWSAFYPSKGGPDYDTAIDDLMRLSQARDFHESDIRGRGAWRDGECISYHDGIHTQGEYDPAKIYLRLPVKDIGINDDPVSPELVSRIKDIVFKMSFETPADVVRCLGWSVLAPFAGALDNRPALLLTGPSESGKTQVANLIIRKLAACEWFNGCESTVAGVRGKIRHDATAIMFEEAEADTPKKKQNREDLFSLMRVNTSNDAPDTVKGTKEGGYNSFKMQNMFGFIAIDPTVENVADENRIFRVNMVKPTNAGEWEEIRAEITRLLCEENCRGIRALTWVKLKIIMALASKIEKKIRAITGRSYRYNFNDAMLASAFIVIWLANDDPSDEQVEATLKKYYNYQPPESNRNEAEEIVDRLLDEVIEVLHDRSREKLSIAECLQKIYAHDTRKPSEGESVSGEIAVKDYRDTLSRNGIRIIDGVNVAIRNNHHAIKRIIERGNGYSKILKRHPGCTESQKNVYFYDTGKAAQCTIITGLIGKGEAEEKFEEDLGALFE